MPSNSAARQAIPADCAEFFGDTPPAGSAILQHLPPVARHGLASLEAVPCWVAWVEEVPEGRDRLTKVPYAPRTDSKASSANPSTWADRTRAAACHPRLLEGDNGRTGGGVGIMLGEFDGLALGGIDLDGCLDIADNVEPWAAEIVDRFDTYTEVSPSGLGLKAFFSYDPADLTACREHLRDSEWGRNFGAAHQGPEIHLGRRFFAVTDQHFDGTPTAIRKVSRETLLWLLIEAGPRFKAKGTAEGKRDRSAVMFGILTAAARAGHSFDEAKAAVMANTPAAAHVADNGRSERVRDRYLSRQWKRAEKAAKSRALTGDDFEDLPPLDPDDERETAGTPSGWHVEAFDPNGEPDLSHDRLALDLGKAGWNRDARYCAPLGGWLLWTGQSWEPAPGMKPIAIVRSFLRAKAKGLLAWAEAKAETLAQDEGEKVVTGARAAAKSLRQDAGISAVERLARSNPKALAAPEQFDRDDFLLGTPDGTVDLRTGELREARRGDYITRLTSVAPAPPGTAPVEWLKFLGDIFPDAPEMIGFHQRLAGYGLTGSTREHRLFLFCGTGRNGKGTLLGTLQGIMGDYAKGVPTTILLESRSPQHAAPLARLRGARLVRGAELPQSGRYGTSRLSSN